jgi:hypothetical protein
MENHKEDILKNFLQETFSDYEPEPSDASWEKIFTAIQPDKPSFWSKSKPWIASGLVILTATLLWYSLGETEKNNTEIAFNERKIDIESDGSLLFKIQSGAEKSDGSLLVKTPIRAEKSDGSLLIKTPTRAETIQAKIDMKISSDYRLTADLSKRVETSTTDTNKEIIVKSDAPKEAEGNHPIVEKQSDESVVDINLTASMSERIATIRTIKQSDGSQTGNIDASRQMETLATDMKINENQRESIKSIVYSSGRVGILAMNTQSDGSQTNENATIEQVRYIRPMENLKNKDFTFTKIDLNSPVITPSILPNREAKPVRQHTYLSMSITPIQTYRILTIQDQNVQNVQTNSIFDSERNGWQFDLGITKPIGKLWSFRTNLSYLRMRQWSEYKVGTDELVLRNNNFGSSNSNPSQDNSADLEVVGQTVRESKMLHMIGLKMDVQKFIKITPKNRYFLSTGTQVMYENSQKQSNIFLNFSAGFQHVISNHTFLTIEPIASYSLNNFNDSKSLLQANGYNLGLKMGVSFRVK